MDRTLDTQVVSGEVGLVIDYRAGSVLAVDILQAAVGMIEALDGLDRVLLSSVDTSLEPVSVLNDVERSSLKMILARALRSMPDDQLRNLEFKKWLGELLVAGKYKLLFLLDSNAPQIQNALAELDPIYKQCPTQLSGYEPPTVLDTQNALQAVGRARSSLPPGQRVCIQTELGDVEIPEWLDAAEPAPVKIGETLVNQGIELFKIKQPDMLGSAQWGLLRNSKLIKVDMLHKSWLDAYHRREYPLMPGDRLKCKYEESITYSLTGDELSRHIVIVEVIEIIRPPEQGTLL